MNFLILKLTCFGYMNPTQKDMKNVYMRQSKLSTNTNSQIKRTLLMGGLYLYSKCSSVYFDFERDHLLKKEGDI